MGYQGAIKFPLPLKIMGMGRYLPKRIVTSEELEKKCGLTSGWCEHKQGVKERRWVDDGETLPFMGARAAENALSRAGMQLKDIDLIINASQAFHQALPENGTLLQREMGLGNSGIPTVSINSACLSFIVALDLASCLIAASLYRNILVVTAEITTGKLDYSNHNVVTMMGDGAAAAVLSRSRPGESSCLHAAHMETYSEASDLSSVAGKDNHRTFFNKMLKKEDFVFDFDPSSLQAVGMKHNKSFLAKLWPPPQYKDLKLVIPNQSSRFAVDFAKLTFPMDSVFGIVDRFGNTGAVGYAMALYEAIEQKRLTRGDLFLMSGMGAGFTLTGLVFTY